MPYKSTTLCNGRLTSVVPYLVAVVLQVCQQKNGDLVHHTLARYPKFSLKHASPISLQNNTANTDAEALLSRCAY